LCHVVRLEDVQNFDNEYLFICFICCTFANTYKNVETHFHRVGTTFSATILAMHECHAQNETFNDGTKVNYLNFEQFICKNKRAKLVSGINLCVHVH